jgi:hypothetical protein
MKRQTVDLLAAEMDEAWHSLRDRLQGLTDEEFFWEPVPNCWTAHADETGHWVLDYAIPDLDPPPFTTIAWRLIHIAMCKVMYHEYAFGPGALTWDTIDIPRTVAGTITLLDDAHARLRAALADLSDRNLEEPRATNWGDQWPTWRIFWVMIAHDLQHGAEIGCLHDLYRETMARK